MDEAFDQMSGGDDAGRNLKHLDGRDSRCAHFRTMSRDIRIKSYSSLEVA